MSDSEHSLAHAHHVEVTIGSDYAKGGVGCERAIRLVLDGMDLSDCVADVAVSSTDGDAALVDMTLHATSGRITFEDGRPSVAWGGVS